MSNELKLQLEILDAIMEKQKQGLPLNNDK